LRLLLRARGGRDGEPVLQRLYRSPPSLRSTDRTTEAKPHADAGTGRWLECGRSDSSLANLLEHESERCEEIMSLR